MSGDDLGEQKFEVSAAREIDVADYTGKSATPESTEAFLNSHRQLIGNVSIAGIATLLPITEELARATAAKFLWPMQEAGRIYRHIAVSKDASTFITEVSVDEADLPQTPAKVLLILAMIASEGFPAQTIAIKRK